MERHLNKLNKAQKEMLALERFFPHHIRENAERTLFALSVLALSFAVFFNIAADTRFGMLWPVAEGLFLVLFSLLLKTILIEIYFHSLRIRLEEHHEISFATLLVIGLHHPRKKDLAKAFLHSRMGREVVSRLGIAKETLRHFVHSKEHADIAVPMKGHFSDLAGHIYDEDPYFRDFLERVHVTRDHLVKASEESERRHHKRLSTKPFLSLAFHPEASPIFSLDHVTRLEIEELERFYRIIITEQATEQIVDFFREDMLHYVSEDARIRVLLELVQSNTSVISPGDVRRFIISKKAEL